MPAAVADPAVGAGLSQAAPGPTPEQAHGHAGEHARQDEVQEAEGFAAQLFRAVAGETRGAKGSHAAGLAVGGAIAQAVSELFPCHLMDLEN